MEEPLARVAANDGLGRRITLGGGEPGAPERGSDMRLLPRGEVVAGPEQRVPPAPRCPAIGTVAPGDVGYGADHTSWPPHLETPGRSDWLPSGEPGWWRHR